MKHRNDVIVTSYIKISQILKLKSKDNTRQTLHTKFYASRVKNKRIRRGVNRVWRVFKSPGKIGLTLPLPSLLVQIPFAIAKTVVPMNVKFCKVLELLDFNPKMPIFRWLPNPQS